MYCNICHGGSNSHKPHNMITSKGVGSDGKPCDVYHGRCNICMKTTEHTEFNPLPRKPTRSIRAMAKRTDKFQFKGEGGNTRKSYKSNMESLAEANLVIA